MRPKMLALLRWKPDSFQLAVAAIKEKGVLSGKRQFSAAIAAIKEKGVLSGKRVERSERGVPGKFDWLEDLSADELKAFIDGKLDIASYQQGDAAVPRRPFIRKPSFN
jgi:hypothetical protein